MLNEFNYEIKKKLTRHSDGKKGRSFLALLFANGECGVMCDSIIRNGYKLMGLDQGKDVCVQENVLIIMALMRTRLTALFAG